MGKCALGKVHERVKTGLGKDSLSPVTVENHVFGHVNVLSCREHFRVPNVLEATTYYGHKACRPLLERPCF